MKPHLILYCCANTAAALEELATTQTVEDLADIRISRLPCSGRTDVLFLLKAIESGADMVLIVGCPQDQCHYVEGSRRAGLRVGYANRLLAEAGLGAQRIRMLRASTQDGAVLNGFLQESVTLACQLGSWKIALPN